MTLETLAESFLSSMEGTGKVQWQNLGTNFRELAETKLPNSRLFIAFNLKEDDPERYINSFGGGGIANELRTLVLHNEHTLADRI